MELYNLKTTLQSKDVGRVELYRLEGVLKSPERGA